MNKFLILLLPLIIISCSTSKETGRGILIDDASYTYGELYTKLTGYNFDGRNGIIKITGKVFDKRDNNALISAMVKLFPPDTTVFTDIQGNYTFRFHTSGKDSLEISYLGFKKIRVGIKSLVEDFLNSK